MIDLQGIADIVSWWSFSDIFEEGGFNSIPFNAGYGLQTIYNIDKPAFRAFELLHETGDVSFGVDGTHPTAGVFGTQNDSHYHILIYNHQIPDAPIQTVNMTITFGPVKPMNYIATIRRIDELNANPIATWNSLGSPEYPTNAQIKQMQDSSEMIHYPMSYTSSNNYLTFEVSVPPHGVASITFHFYKCPIIDLFPSFSDHSNIK